jgi:hypothetical protein
VGLQEGVLLAGAGLNGAPVASEDVLVGRDQAQGTADAVIAPGQVPDGAKPETPKPVPSILCQPVSERPTCLGWHRGA